MARSQVKGTKLVFTIIYCDQISLSNSILFKGEKIIIPKAMQPEMLKLIHRSHLGIAKSFSWARDVLYWPGISSQILNAILSCVTFNTYVSKKEPERVFDSIFFPRLTMV